MDQTPKSMINRSLTRLNNFHQDFTALTEQIIIREIESKFFINDLPPQMDSMFDKLQQLVEQANVKLKKVIF